MFVSSIDLVAVGDSEEGSAEEEGEHGTSDEDRVEVD